MKTLIILLFSIIFSTQAFGLCIVNCEGGGGLVDGALERATGQGDKSRNQSTAEFKQWGVGFTVHALSSGSQNSVSDAGLNNKSFFVENYFSPYFSIGGTYITADFAALDDPETGETVNDDYKHSHIIGYVGGRVWITNVFQIYMQAGVTSSSIDFSGKKWEGSGVSTGIGFKYQANNSSPLIGVQQTAITGQSNDNRLNIGFNSISVTLEIGI